jgi:hypothetical protein
LKLEDMEHSKNTIDVTLAGIIMLDSS